MAADGLTWATTGAINSRYHIAVIEPFQAHAICGVGISWTTEIRPRLSTRVCEKCVREVRKRGSEWFEVGLENDLA